MKRRRASVISALAAAALAAAGCSSVYSTRPVGQKPADIERESREWEGTWTLSGGAFTVAVADGSNGVLRIGWVERDGARLFCRTNTVWLRDGAGWRFASIRDEEARGAERYLWGRIKRDGRQTLVWVPSAARFRKMIEKGALPGRTNRSEVVVGELDARQLALIASETNVVFEWDAPMVFIRTGD